MRTGPVHRVRILHTTKTNKRSALTAGANPTENTPMLKSVKQPSMEGTESRESNGRGEESALFQMSERRKAFLVSGWWEGRERLERLVRCLGV
ncbi:hypothetical protein Nepgr_006852 [Nepenthes gracilis]|uniref:Uncharacterized protein n=1 Tax=Nepenthes gracilis TaxID=150966 RepID=A0AAD3S6L3_NEPGR|nr:hypothetical protein Nepgr_006852 [Nepenthes gracilis]